jgi:hypothetical protein
MTSDINGTVVGIQGNPVAQQSLSSNEDGYVLTWDNPDGYWAARPIPSSGGLRKDYVTSSGTWVAPDGVTSVLLIAAGGGQGGNYGGGPGSGGCGSLQVSGYVPVTPGVTYTVTIGAGGNGGTVGSPSSNYGASTTFANGGTTLFSAQGATVAGTFAFGIMHFVGSFGGLAGSTINGGNGSANYINTYSPGSGATGSGACGVGFAYGGGGGGAGPQGNGGNGGAATAGGNGANGSNGAANTGAGGGGGGGVCSGSGFTPGNGGNGGSGYMYIIY